MKAEVLGVSWAKFKDNLYVFFSTNSVLIFLWCMTAVMDAYSTTLFMKIVGPEHELHPMTRLLSYKLGIFTGPYVAGVLKITMALPILVCWNKFGSCILLAGIIFQLLAVNHNYEIYSFLFEQIPIKNWWISKTL